MTQAQEKPEWQRKHEETIRMRTDMRGRHYLLCTHMDEFKSAVEQIPMDERARAELLNLATVVMRMAVTHNGGALSTSKLAAF
jgi:hypothetical protein